MSSINVSSDNIEHIRIGILRANYNAAQTRILRYYIDFHHKTLNLHKELGAPEIDILQGKVNVLMKEWDEKYERYLTAKERSAGKSMAEDATIDAENSRKNLREILATTLKVDDAIKWDDLKKSENFHLKNFLILPYPFKPPQIPHDELPPRPIKIGLLDKVFGQEKKKLARNNDMLQSYNDRKRVRQEAYNEAVSAWETKKAKWDKEKEEERALKEEEQIAEQQEFEESQRLHNEKVEQLKLAWQNGDGAAIVEYTTIVLDASKYPDLITKEFEVDFDPTRRVLLVEYLLPNPSDLPTAKTVRFNPTTGELTETKIASTEIKELYDSVCYQVCLRTLHELFEADTPKHVMAVAFNGVVRSISAATGHEVSSVLLSVFVEREQFLAINLRQVDPKACFKSLKGVSASSLIGMAAITPVLTLNKVDKRFIEGRSVEIENTGEVNIASMHWDDFEHLVRELFEKEFAARGGEVRVTQASSDGGVDAVAFDPDPISGGKIVIQAKRYTKTVGVAAVRDLYGTTQAEGANKGILVTTADFGPDAYQFAQGKPLTLMNGSNLLSLLQKHGIRAKINLADARRELGLTEKV